MTLDKGDRKVLMVLESNYPTEGGGGAEGQLRTICRYLKEHDIPVSIIVPMRQDGAQCEHDSIDGVSVWRIPYPKLRKVGGFVMLARLMIALFKRCRDYHVIHVHMAHNMASVSSAVGWLLGKTVIVKITGSLEMADGVLDSGRRSPGVVIKRWLLRHATYFQATSHEIRNRLIENGIDANRVRVIPNAVDLARFAAMTKSRDASTGRPMTMIYVGRLSEEKAPDVLLEAWIDAIPVDSRAQLMLIGDGAMRASLEQKITQAGRAGQVVLHGPQEDIGPFLAQADVAVLPSLYEGLSNALLEYMASGLPVLGTRVSGTVDFIEDGQCGWLVEPGDKEQLAGRLRTLMSMDRARLREMGEMACQRVASRARIERVIGQLAELYEIDADLLKHKPQGKLI
ncbi:MAG TPA: glycosyltransferase family 4 protein [Gammaproteobacteria bacterium]